jgi:hypothetical protein
VVKLVVRFIQSYENPAQALFLKIAEAETTYHKSKEWTTTANVIEMTISPTTTSQRFTCAGQHCFVADSIKVAGYLQPIVQQLR